MRGATLDRDGTGEDSASLWPPALSIHQLAAQGELSQLKEHLRKGVCPHACASVSMPTHVRQCGFTCWCVRVAADMT